ncbi:MAG: hypothetical protein RLZZ339_1954 [Cyanobacteriota bacterium]|jgi:hypothetical protein
MSYYDEAIKHLKLIRPDDIPNFQMRYQAGKSKILASERLFRLMSHDEAILWNRLSPPNAEGMPPELMHTLFMGGGGYTSKWFTFDRPYLFGRQAINVPGGREGQGFLMILLLGFEMKNTILKKLLPDVRLAGLPDNLKDSSCRCKVEGGTITLGIPLLALEKMAKNMIVERLSARLTPFHGG